MADGCGSSSHWYLYAMHKLPLDKKWYEQDPRSQKIHAGLVLGSLQAQSKLRHLVHLLSMAFLIEVRLETLANSGHVAPQQDTLTQFSE
ncbi:MAG: hypothetical protein R3C17_05570 [Planctomycetaceae bacterium]